MTTRTNPCLPERATRLDFFPVADRDVIARREHDDVLGVVGAPMLCEQTMVGTSAVGDDAITEHNAERVRQRTSSAGDFNAFEVGL